MQRAAQSIPSGAQAGRGREGTRRRQKGRKKMEVKAQGLSEVTVFGERVYSWKRRRPGQREGGGR